MTHKSELFFFNDVRYYSENSAHRVTHVQVTFPQHRTDSIQGTDYIATSI